MTMADTTRLRQRDFSPVADPRAEGDPAMMQGASRFAAFLEEELKPWIGDRFDVARDDFGLLGYSQGGLFATHLLLTRPSAFQPYGIGSPSYWYGPKVIFAQCATSTTRRTRARRYGRREAWYSAKPCWFVPPMRVK